MSTPKITTDENLMKRLNEQGKEIVTLEDGLEATRKENEDLKKQSDIKNMFIVNLNKQCIALKLELGRKLTLNEIEFLKKSCM